MTHNMHSGITQHSFEDIEVTECIEKGIID